MNLPELSQVIDRVYVYLNKFNKDTNRWCLQVGDVLEQWHICQEDYSISCHRTAVQFLTSRFRSRAFCCIHCARRTIGVPCTGHCPLDVLPL